jgi:hypothetical protein
MAILRAGIASTPALVIKQPGLLTGTNARCLGCHDFEALCENG